jgi:hypothetical protein
VAVLDIVVFSKDRACQLELLLRSLERFFLDLDRARVAVLYTHSSEAFARGYALVRELHPVFEYVCERESELGFRELTIGLLGRRPYTTFFVDDDVLTAPVSLDCPEFEALSSDPELLCLSLRLRPGMDYDYAIDRRIAAPRLENGTWDWRGAEGSWGYPMSVEGHVFRTVELLPLMRRLPFSNPNTFEAVLAQHPLERPRMICRPDGALANLPHNLVQDIYSNRHGGLRAEDLNQRFLGGERLSLHTAAGIRIPGVQIDLPLLWEGDSTPASADARPRISVVIGAGPGDLAATVASVCEQRLPDVEIVLIEDWSDPARLAAARGQLTAHPDVPIRLLQAPRALAASNPALHATRGEFVLTLPAGERLGSGFLARALMALEAAPDAAYAYPAPAGTAPFSLRELTAVNHVGRVALLHRADWHGAGWFDEDGPEPEWDLWLALGARGRAGVPVPGDAGPSATGAPAADVRERLVRRHPQLFSVAERAQATGGTCEPPADGLRSFVTVACARVAAASPGLLRAYARWFGPGDDATLLLYAPAGGDGDVTGPLLAAVAEAGLSDSEGPALTLLCVPAAEGDAAVGRVARAVIGAAAGPGALARLPRYTPDDVAGLYRQFAQARDAAA